MQLRHFHGYFHLMSLCLHDELTLVYQLEVRLVATATMAIRSLLNLYIQIISFKVVTFDIMYHHLGFSKKNHKKNKNMSHLNKDIFMKSCFNGRKYSSHPALVMRM